MNYSSDSLVRARVCEAAQEHYYLRFEDGAECDAVPAGALRWSAELPAVGDWVRARRADATLALIENVEPRTTCISRQRPGGGGEQVLAANVDLIAIVMGLDGDYNLRRLERYLVLAAASGAEAMVVLNKMDVCAEWPERLADVRAITRNAAALSAHESKAPIVEVVRGRTLVLLGSSGAGKSTITNALLGESRQPTQPVRESDSRGRHTTTRRMLIELPDGGALIDTPGLRELALWARQDSVDDVPTPPDKTWLRRTAPRPLPYIVAPSALPTVKRPSAANSARGRGGVPAAHLAAALRVRRSAVCTNNARKIGAKTVRGGRKFPLSSSVPCHHRPK
jgi:ribosome small subunit-dependent GTPase A